MKTILAAVALAAVALTVPALAEPVPSARRVYMLCAIEDSACVPMILEAYARVAPQYSRCPAGETLPDRVLFGALSGMLPHLAAIGPAQPIDWVVSSAIATISPDHCSTP